MRARARPLSLDVRHLQNYTNKAGLRYLSFALASVEISTSYDVVLSSVEISSLCLMHASKAVRRALALRLS